MKTTHRARKISDNITYGKIQLHNCIFELEEKLQELVHAVHAVRAHRQMNAAEPPEQQDAWNRLQTATRKAEQLPRNPLDKPRP